MGMLVAYDTGGQIVATLDYLVQYDNDGEPLGVVDFAAHEVDGGENLDIWNVSGASGSKFWPEKLGAAAHQFAVELAGDPGQKRIAALVHNRSGHRRERGEATGGRVAVDEDGRTKEPPGREKEPSRLPLMGVRR